MPTNARAHAQRHADKPIVLITGFSGAIGSALTAALADDYRVVGLDRDPPGHDADWFELDLGDQKSVDAAMARFRERFGSRIASVVHLAAYFDFTGEPNPLYQKVNIDGTRHLLRALRDFDVGQFVYSGTMLVHEPTEPGGRIDESAPIAPKWAYPESKAAAEQVIRDEHGDIPYVLLHLAGLYDDEGGVPTLTQQIARIYERDFHSHLYAGDLDAGQSMLHQDDMVDAFRRTIDRRGELPHDTTILVGEPDAMSYRELQQRLGKLIHGEREWATITLPEPVAKLGAWAEEVAEPIIPDAIDKGEKPFIRPFMIDMASDHYALDIGKARRLLGWEPRHRLHRTLPKIVAALKRDPVAWYEANRITPPESLESADEAVDDPESLRRNHTQAFAAEHRRNLWGGFLVLALGTWLLSSPPTMGYAGTPLAWSDYASGVALIVLGALSLSPRLAALRWGSALVGFWLLWAPLVFWTPSAAGYLNSTLVGALAIGFAVGLRPAPGVDAVARMTGPTVPPGWEFTPSSWMQRLPIIVLAFVGLYLSRYMTAYQLGHIDGVWDPFFAGGPGPKNGTEEIITSYVSEAWPVPDAGLGALTYMLEILVGVIGSDKRWRTMPWLVMLFGVMIVPLGAVSITFIIIQPILLGTWCTVCLIGAAAMLIQIPYSLDELVACGQFLVRRKKAGKNVLRVFFVGDTDEGRDPPGFADTQLREFSRAPTTIVRDALGGGVNLPWNLVACIVIGLSLMLTRITLGAEGAMANWDHLIGALIVTVTVSSLAEVGRIARWLNLPLAAVLLVTPFVYDVSALQMVNSLACGAAVVALSLRRGPVRHGYGSWQRWIV